MNPAEPKNVFQRLVEALLERAVDAGLQLPIVFVLMSVNGYVSAIRYSRAPNGDWDPKLLVEGKEPPGVFPVHLFFSDASGKLLNAKIESPGDHPKWVQ
jgi:hypothetical protein